MSEQIQKCANCGERPSIAENRGGYFAFTLRHENPLCPYNLWSDQHSRADCIRDWNRHNRRAA